MSIKPLMVNRPLVMSLYHKEKPVSASPYKSRAPQILKQWAVSYAKGCYPVFTDGSLQILKTNSLKDRDLTAQQGLMSKNTVCGMRFSPSKDSS